MSIDAREISAVEDQYSALDKDVRALTLQRQWTQVIAVFDEMIHLLETQGGHLEEATNRLRRLQARKCAMTARIQKEVGGSDVARLLRDAAEWSIPASCRNESCSTDPTVCEARRSLLSGLEKQMCAERVQHLVEWHKTTAAICARTMQSKDALLHRREAVRLNQLAMKLSPTRQKELSKNHDYLSYWLEVTEGVNLLAEARFSDSADHFRKAHIFGAKLNQKRCFPNYFVDIQELAVHQQYVDALKHVSSAHWSAAKESFQTWLNVRSTGRRSIRADNIAIYARICDVLIRLGENRATYNDWIDLEKMLDTRYLARSTWALWDQLQLIRQLSSKARAIGTTSDAGLLDEVRQFSQHWRLFMPDAVLLGEDLLAGLRRQVAYPTFLDVFSDLEPTRQWQAILRQTLKNLFLLMADYERKRYLNPPPEELHLSRLLDPRVASERMTLREISDVVMHFLQHRPGHHGEIFQKALSHLPDFEAALESGDFYLARSLLDGIFDVIRSWPHTIQVISVSEDRNAFRDDDRSNSPLFRVEVKRLWSLDPKVTIFETAEPLRSGDYYYLRPKWNTRLCDRYRVRHERFHHASLPRSMSTFYDGLFSSQVVPSPKFERWILQFRETERLLACKLFGALRIYDKDSIVGGWQTIYEQLPTVVQRGLVSGKAIITRLGHGAKSGALEPYYFKQAMFLAPEYSRIYAEIAPRLFPEISSITANSAPEIVVFLDDFIGTGGQAEEFLEWYFPRHEWIKEAKLFLAVLVGFRSAMERVRSLILASQPNCKIEVIAATTLEESDRAFAEANPLWESQPERIAARDWAHHLGQEILRDHKGFSYNAVEDALGWKGCEALVTFDHNIPSDTLPIFWANGERAGQSWNWLFKRFD